MFHMLLAAHMRMSVKRLLREFDSREISEWKAFNVLHPLDHARRAEVSAGTIAAAFAAQYSTSPQRASNYMRDYEAEFLETHPPEGPTPEAVAAKIDAIFGSIASTAGAAGG